MNGFNTFNKGDYVVHRDHIVLVLGDTPNRPALHKHLHLACVDPAYPEAQGRTWWAYEDECRSLSALLATKTESFGQELATYIETLGIVCSTFTSGTSAVDKLQSPDVVDVVLTSLEFDTGSETGYDVLVEAKNLSSGMCPVFGIGDVSEASPPEGYSFNLYLQRPVTVDVLLYNIASLVGFERF